MIWDYCARYFAVATANAAKAHHHSTVNSIHVLIGFLDTAGPFQILWKGDDSLRHFLHSDATRLLKAMEWQKISGQDYEGSVPWDRATNLVNKQAEQLAQQFKHPELKAEHLLLTFYDVVARKGQSFFVEGCLFITDRMLARYGIDLGMVRNEVWAKLFLPPPATPALIPVAEPPPDAKA